MYQLFESIRLFNGEFSRLELHQTRIDFAFKDLIKAKAIWNLEKLLANAQIPSHGLFKCRVSYNEADVEVKFIPYQIKPVQTLKLVEDNSVSYLHKLEDRVRLNELWSLRGDCDDILIIRNGLVTDTLNTNIVFRRDDQWITPTTYLLNGTMRQFLLTNGVIAQEPIDAARIRRFKQFKLINALLDWESPALEVSNIY